MDIEKIRQGAAYIESVLAGEKIEKPLIGIVLGSGLGQAANIFDKSISIPYSDICGMPVSTVSGHDGKYIIGQIENKTVIMMQGRVHYYEGYSMEQVVMPIRLMGLLGIKVLLLTNAAGGISSELNPGDMMVISDHISSFVPSPLIGPNCDSLGVRFPDMTCVYDRELREKLRLIFKEKNIAYKEGVYLQTTGPEYETPAEIKLFELLGADAVGMSTVCEAIAARHMGIRVAGISTISNKAAGLAGKALSHKDVMEISDLVSVQMTDVIRKFICQLNKEQ